MRRLNQQGQQGIRAICLMPLLLLEKGMKDKKQGGINSPCRDVRKRARRRDTAQPLWDLGSTLTRATPTRDVPAQLQFPVLSPPTALTANGRWQQIDYWHCFSNLGAGCMALDLQMPAWECCLTSIQRKYETVRLDNGSLSNLLANKFINQFHRTNAGAVLLVLLLSGWLLEAGAEVGH